MQDDDNTNISFKAVYYKNVDLTLVLVLSDDFTDLIIKDIIKKISDNKITQESLNKFIKEHQNPKNFDQLTKIKNDVNNVRDIMRNNIEKALERDEKLEDLFKKSEQLEDSSRAFHKVSKKMNRCCIIM